MIIDLIISALLEDLYFTLLLLLLLESCQTSYLDFLYTLVRFKACFGLLALILSSFGSATENVYLIVRCTDVWSI